MQREKRSRARKLYDAYCIAALYRELFDVCRFASIPTYSLFRHESARTPRGQNVKRSRSTKPPLLSGTFERSHGVFHKHREVKRSRSNQFSLEMCLDILKFHTCRRITILTHLFLSHFTYTVRLREKPRKRCIVTKFSGKPVGGIGKL